MTAEPNSCECRTSGSHSAITPYSRLTKYGDRNTVTGNAVHAPGQSLALGFSVGLGTAKPVTVFRTAFPDCLQFGVECGLDCFLRLMHLPKRLRCAARQHVWKNIWILLDGIF